MTGTDDILTGLFPRLAELGATLSRGRSYEHVKTAAGVSLERPAMTILINLKTADGPLRVGEIATRMQVEGPHVTRHLNGLEQRGLVERVVDADDRRARRVALTAEGEETADRYLAAVRDWFGEALSDWPEGDRRDLTRLLGRLIDDLGTHAAGEA